MVQNASVSNPLEKDACAHFYVCALRETARRFFRRVEIITKQACMLLALFLHQQTCVHLYVCQLPGRYPQDKWLAQNIPRCHHY